MVPKLRPIGQTPPKAQVQEKVASIYQINNILIGHVFFFTLIAEKLLVNFCAYFTTFSQSGFSNNYFLTIIISWPLSFITLIIFPFNCDSCCKFLHITHHFWKNCINAYEKYHLLNLDWVLNSNCLEECLRKCGLCDTCKRISRGACYTDAQVLPQVYWVKIKVETENLHFFKLLR